MAPRRRRSGRSSRERRSAVKRRQEARIKGLRAVMERIVTSSTDDADQLREWARNGVLADNTLRTRMAPDRPKPAESKLEVVGGD